LLTNQSDPSNNQSEQPCPQYAASTGQYVANTAVPTWNPYLRKLQPGHETNEPNETQPRITLFHVALKSQKRQECEKEEVTEIIVHATPTPKRTWQNAQQVPSNVRNQGKIENHKERPEKQHGKRRAPAMRGGSEVL
jgi:hypothetical protein